MVDNPDREAAKDAFGCEVKRCSRCREWLPADLEFFPKNAGTSDGMHCWCKACWHERRHPVSLTA